MKVLRQRSVAAYFSAFFIACMTAFLPQGGNAAERGRIMTFLEVTGFDVALDSIALSASDAPRMLGLDAGDFGAGWAFLSDQVFDTEEMRDLALDILVETLSETALAHAEAFYGSELGQRLVAAENAAHMVEDDEVKQTAGQRIISDLVRAGSDRIALLQRMNSAIDAADSGVKALQQIQFRLLMAASSAGVVDLTLDAEALRAWQKEQVPAMRMAVRASSLAASAYTYQGFSDEEVLAYVRALETPLMQEVYELLNAVQYEVIANRFEALAYRMKDLTQGEDI